VQIPAALEEQLGLAKLARLSDDDFASIRESIANVPRGMSRGRFESAVASSIFRIPKEDVQEIVSAMMYLASYRTPEASLPEFVESIVSELQKHGVIPEQTRRLTHRLLDILRLDSVRLRTKSTELAFENSTVFQSGRVITDLRPVFGLNASLEVAGALVVHTLKIEYFTGEGPKEIYISLDDDDIAVLIQLLHRAKQKSAVLRDLLKKSEIVDLNPRDLSENA
jgi:hypothetical protein